MLFRINPNGNSLKIVIQNRYRNEFKTNTMEIKTYMVEGMACKNCKFHVETGIKNIPGVEEVIADLANGQVRVSGELIDTAKVKQSVEESGYHFKGEILDHNTLGSGVWF